VARPGDSATYHSLLVLVGGPPGRQLLLGHDDLWLVKSLVRNHFLIGLLSEL